MTTARNLLVFNAGSSSLKFAVFEAADGSPTPRLRGAASGIGRSGRFTAAPEGQAGVDTDADFTDHAAAIAYVLAWLADAGYGLDGFSGAGHRVVHGGGVYAASTRITDEILDELAGFARLAPHHQPHSIAAIEALRELAPELPQIACFDTAFHATIPEVATVLPLPRVLRETGLRRYGFHGLSYANVVRRLPAVSGAGLPARVLACHLGNGASLCAIRDGTSVATTMGFSTLDGLVMATRSGAIDPGVLLHLMSAEGMSASALERLLYDQSGLLALSGVSADMRQLLADTSADAAFAVEVYCTAIARHAGAMISAMQGLDAVVFTGGIGENAAPIREKVMRTLAWTGLAVDRQANDRGEARLSAPGSPVAAYIIAADEEGVIAAETMSLLR